METSDKIHSGTRKNENSKERADIEHNVHFTMYNVSCDELLFIHYLLSASTAVCKPLINQTFYLFRLKIRKAIF